MEKEATIETKEVAWSNGIITKYQTVMSYPLSDTRTIHLMGEPKSTKVDAYTSLYVEFNNWQKAMKAFGEALSKSLI